VISSAREELAREIVGRALGVVDEVPAGLRAAAFCKTFDFLADGDEPEQPPPGSVLNRRRHPTVQDRGEGASSTKSRSSSGPKGLAERLLESGFFDEARSVEAVAGHMRLNYARTYLSKDVSKTLIRLVQEGKLRREKNADGKLLYKKG
jgi:hypothetical protein